MSDDTISAEDIQLYREYCAFQRPWAIPAEQIILRLIHAYEAAVARIATLEGEKPDSTGYVQIPAGLVSKLTKERDALREQLAARDAEVAHYAAALKDVTDACEARDAEVAALRSRHAEAEQRALNRAAEVAHYAAALKDVTDACEARDAEIAALKRAGRPRCLDCIPHDDDAYTPCVRHGGCEHGFHDPSHPYFGGWDDTWEHWRARAELAETEVAHLRSVIDGLQREAAVAARDGSGVE